MKKDANDMDMGVIGSVSMLQNASLSTQPITSFDWSPDKVSDVWLIYRGYYTVARRYEFYVLVARTISHE